MCSSVRNLVALSLMPSFNSGTNIEFISRCGGINAMFEETSSAYNALCKDFNYDKRSLNRNEALALVDKELALIEKNNISVCSIESSLYPYLLKQIIDYPIVFYYKGNINYPPRCKTLSIVGTRNASVACKDSINGIVDLLSTCSDDIVITSGLAYGIDACAHRAALQSNLRTFAVLGHGLNKIYPAAHANLAKEILNSNGALISEFPISLSISPNNFLKRNRIVAGLSAATLIGESAIKGGSMTTARLALAYNRDVFAIPGRPSDTYSRGCNQLIKENVAALVESGNDLIKLLGMNERSKQVQTKLNIFDEDPDAELILSIITKKQNCHIDDLVHLSKFSIARINSLLIQLEMENKIQSLLGSCYCVK